MLASIGFHSLEVAEICCVLFEPGDVSLHDLCWLLEQTFAEQSGDLRVLSVHLSQEVIFEHFLAMLVDDAFLVIDQIAHRVDAAALIVGFIVVQGVFGNVTVQAALDPIDRKLREREELWWLVEEHFPEVKYDFALLVDDAAVFVN